jgi:hypothetical protein
MATLPKSFVFAQVPSTSEHKAFEFHRTFASRDPHIHPRTESEMKEFAQSGQLLGVRRGDTNGFVGLCYVVHDSAESAWQLGGLTVTMPRMGIGKLLVRFALAHTMVYGELLQEGRWVRKIIAYVHKENKAPRGLLKDLRFQHSGEIVFSLEGAPSWMKRNAQRLRQSAKGSIAFEEFTFTSDGLRELATWFYERFDGTLHSRRAEAEIDLGPISLEEFKEDLRELAATLES